MQSSAPRLTSVMGVARALISTVGADVAVDVLIVEFGWDLTFQALALLRGEDAERAFALSWEYLVFGRYEQELRGVPQTRDA